MRLLVTVTNLTTSNISINSLGLSLSGGETDSAYILNPDDLRSASDELESLRDAGHISFKTDDDPDIDNALEGAQLDDVAGSIGSIAVKFDAAPDVSGGAVSGVVGFQLVHKLNGSAIAREEYLQFAFFDDVDMSVPSVNATLDTAAEGSIIAGAAGSALKVRTNASGRFSCVLSDATDETVTGACTSDFGGPAIDGRDNLTVIFSA